MGDGLTLGVGAYLMIIEILGGIVLHAIALASPAGENRDAEGWTPPETAQGYSSPTSRRIVDPDDPFRIVD